jgi:hypothetical protein
LPEITDQGSIMATIRSFAERHPQITAWIVLAIGMVIILVLSAREVGFTAGQWAALIVTTILLAGACVWIIGWGDAEEAKSMETYEGPKADETEGAEKTSGSQPGNSG